MRGSRGVCMIYGKNIIPKGAPIVFYSGEWMSKRDFEALSGDKGAHRATMYLIFYNDSLKIKKPKSYNTVFAVAYHNYRNCEIISQIIEIAEGPMTPNMKTIIEFSNNWGADTTYGFLSDTEDDQIYYLAEINTFKDLFTNILKCKSGQIKNLKFYKVK